MAKTIIFVMNSLATTTMPMLRVGRFRTTALTVDDGRHGVLLLMTKRDEGNHCVDNYDSLMLMSLMIVKRGRTNMNATMALTAWHC